MKLFALSLIIAASSAAVEKVNINMADATALDKIYNVGSVTAQRIINHRKNVAPFASVEELKLINGIGQATFDTMMQKGNDGSYAKPVVGVACPMTCEVKSVHYHKDLAVNDTTILKIQHVSNLASGAHGPATKHPLCGGSKAKFCAPRQRLLHKCYKIGDGSTCACVCDVCTDAHNKAPCHPNKICGDDVAGDPLVYDSATDKCLKCGRWSGDRACANNMCLATDVNHAHKQLVYDPVAKTCARCGHGVNRIACDNNVCEATDVNHAHKQLVYDPVAKKCARCGHGHNKIACDNNVCEATSNSTGKKIAFNPDNGKCWNCGTKHNLPACNHASHATPCAAVDSVTGKALVLDAATGKCVKSP